MATHIDAPLVAAISQYCQNDPLRFHMPGHKGGPGAPESLRQIWGELWRWDLTEVQGLDNLAAPTGPIQQAQQQMADYRGAKEAFFLTQGATVGLQAALFACCQPGDEVILPRHAHNSLWSALVLRQLQPVWLPVDDQEPYGIPLGVSEGALAAALCQHPHAKAVLWVHPTPYGLMKGLPEAVRLCKEAGIPLLVDSAHGGHLAPLAELPDPVALGADVIVEGWHKTMGSLTQTAVLFQQNTALPVERYLRLLHTSSPSYPLLASLDAARAFWQQRQPELTRLLRQTATQLRQGLENIDGLSLLRFPQQDPTRCLLVSDWGHNGYQVAACLRQAGVEPEMADGACVVLLLTLGDTEAAVSGLLSACQQVAEQLKKQLPEPLPLLEHLPAPQIALTPAAAFAQPEEICSLRQAAGRIASRAIIPYPPGVPLLGTGEYITAETVAWLQATLRKGGNIQGLADLQTPSLWVLKEHE